MIFQYNIGCCSRQGFYAVYSDGVNYRYHFVRYFILG